MSEPTTTDKFDLQKARALAITLSNADYSWFPDDTTEREKITVFRRKQAYDASTMLRAACDALEHQQQEAIRLNQLVDKVESMYATKFAERDTLARENERLRAALQFYETWENYLGHFSVCVIARDKGKTARSALAKENPDAVIK